MRVCFLTVACASALLAQTPPPLLQAPIGPDTVVAIAAGKNLTAADIQKMLVGVTPQALQAFQQNPQETIKQLLFMRYLAAEAEKAKLGEQSPSKEQIAFLMASLLASLEINQEQNGYTVPAEDIDKFYAGNQARWEQAKIKIIFIAFKPAAAAPAKPEIKPEDLAEAARRAVDAAHSPSDRSEAEARKLASDLVQQLRAGADFVKLVEQYSDEPASKAAGGDFGSPITSTSAFSEDFKRPILALKKGEIGDPIRQPNGFYVVRLEDRSVRSLNEVRETIVQELRSKHRDEWVKETSNRFQPAIQRPEFFVQPGKYMSAPPGQPLPPSAPKP